MNYSEYDKYDNLSDLMDAILYDNRNENELERSRGYCKALAEGILAVRRSTKEHTMKKMTRSEAIEKFHEIMYPTKETKTNRPIAEQYEIDRKWAEKAITAYEALGLIEFEEEKRSDPAKLIAELYSERQGKVGIMFGDCAIKVLIEHGYTITKK